MVGRTLLSLLPLLISLSMSITSVQTTYLPSVSLGFLLPFPQSGSFVPPRLANEWISAARVAINVLNNKYKEHFAISISYENSNCAFESAVEAAQRLLDAKVVAVVGPACSEAVRGAATVFGHYHIPFISFAATAAEFGVDRTGYKTFFRTAFSDEYQAQAFKSVVEAFEWKHLHVFYGNDAYGRPLAEQVKQLVNETARVHLIQVPTDPPPTNYSALFLDYNTADPTVTISSNATTAVLLLTMPTDTEEMFKAAQKLGKLKYPWWYLGGDGVTAFDLVGQGDPLASLAKAIQGEIGISPYKGDYNPHSSELIQFIEFWKQQQYDNFPGLLTFDATRNLNETRAYVPYLFDAVWALFEAFNNTLKISPVTPHAVYSCLMGHPAECVKFKGCTGEVAFDPSTGGRNHSLSPAEYHLVNLNQMTWESKATWKEEKLVRDNFSIPFIYLTRPGPIPPSPSTPPGSNLSEETTASAPYSAPANLFAAAAVSSNFSNLSTASTVPPPPPRATAQPIFLHAHSPPPLGPEPPFQQTVNTAKGKTNTTIGTAAAPPPPAERPKKGGGISGGVVAVIVILLLVAAGGGAAFFILRKRARDPDRQRFIRML